MKKLCSVLVLLLVFGIAAYAVENQFSVGLGLYEIEKMTDGIDYTEDLKTKDGFGVRLGYELTGKRGLSTGVEATFVSAYFGDYVNILNGTVLGKFGVKFRNSKMFKVFTYSKVGTSLKVLDRKTSSIVLAFGQDLGIEVKATDNFSMTLSAEYLMHYSKDVWVKYKDHRFNVYYGCNFSF